MNVYNIISTLCFLVALIVCIIAWLGVAVKDPVLLALGFYFLGLLIDRLSGIVVSPQPVNRG